MDNSRNNEMVQALEDRIAQLTQSLTEARAAVQRWTEANASISRRAAKARAENQAAGRGLTGALLGSRFRTAARAGAAASNAALAKEVAEERSRIADRKLKSQDTVRQIQAQLTAARHELKALTSATKSKTRIKAASAKAAITSLDLLMKLKQAREAGLLTEEEFEEKRKRLVSDL